MLSTLFNSAQVRGEFMYVSQMHADQRSRIGLPKHIDLLARFCSSVIVASAFAVFARAAGDVFDSWVPLNTSLVLVGLQALRCLYFMGVWVSEMGLVIDRFGICYRGFIKSWRIRWTHIESVDGLTLVHKTGDLTFVGQGYGLFQSAQLESDLRLRHQQSLHFDAMTLPVDPPLIETHRLQLRPWGFEDFDSFRRLYTSANVRRYNGYRFQRGRALAGRFNRLIKPPSSARGCCWNWRISISDQQADESIIGFFDAWLAPKTNSAVFIAYALDFKYQGQGLMSETLDQMCILFLDAWGFDAVQATVLVNNEPSIKLLERNGFNPITAADETGAMTYRRRRSSLSHDQVAQNFEGF
ncbi:MAG: GNAT family N-acetyltransferase [Myxococcota bacterium]|nr:GNAT family N-acetyltransferase [Myxococcota bacterium]